MPREQSAPGDEAGLREAFSDSARLTPELRKARSSAMEIRNPATTEVLSEVAEDSPASVLEKYGRARSGQPIWAATPLPTRLAAIARFRDLLSARKDELALTLTRE
ncbi:MAG TPA: aldehyde dehydrogenase family protein, partial [Polyangiaceae bacterium]|nr:aldehyde dehydrogenase family protein [Polyangiaceae bacterium]